MGKPNHSATEYIHSVSNWNILRPNLLATREEYMAYRNKTYICFDGDKDMKYYRLMTAWSENKNINFGFYNAHDLNSSRDSSKEESIKKQLRERFANSKTFVVLIGESTRYLTKFVKWEMEVALRLDLPIIGVNLNGNRQQDELCPPAIRHALAVYIPFGAKILEFAMNDWPRDHVRYRANGKTGPYHYTNRTYLELGINI